MKTIKISTDEAKELIHDYRNQIFTCKFVKKDGSHRIMNARLGVKKGVKGVGLNYNPDDYNHIIAYDLKNDGFRTININTLLYLRTNKKKYTIVQFS